MADIWLKFRLEPPIYHLNGFTPLLLPSPFLRPRPVVSAFFLLWPGEDGILCVGLQALHPLKTSG